MVLSVPIPIQQPDRNILGTSGKPVRSMAFERGHTTIPISCLATLEISSSETLVICTTKSGFRN